jgi:HEXXH motif-containing protein
VALLFDGMVSTRTLLLNLLVSEATAKAPQIADRSGLADAHRRLGELRRSFPTEVAALLAYPHIGVWLGRVFPLLRRFPDDPQDRLWADFGYLGWIAAVGEIACIPRGTAIVVVRGGVVMLPGMGLARLGPDEYCGNCELAWSDDGSLQFTHAGATVRVKSRDEQTHTWWQPLRRICGAAGEPEVFLDDLDPFRDLPHDTSPPGRLSEAESLSWQRDFGKAWDLLRHDFGRYLEPMRQCLTSLAPLTATPTVEAISYTVVDGLGCVYSGAPVDSCQLAVTLIHEIQHTKFTLLTDQVLICEADNECRFYAPWRDGPRPIFGLLHGIYAFFGVTDFWRSHREVACHRSRRWQVEFEFRRVQLEQAIQRALSSGLLTTAGEEFVTALGGCMQPWRAEDVPEDVRNAAFEASLAHKVFWQVRNWRPAADGLADLVTRWRTGDRCPIACPGASLIDQKTIPDHYRRLRLSTWLRPLDAKGMGTRAMDALPAGDRAYLMGDIAGASALYVEEIRRESLRPQSWAGLALALRKLFPHTALSVLDDSAYVAAELYQTLRADGDDPDLIDLLRWLSPDELAPTAEPHHRG